MSDAKTGQKRWQINVQAELDIDSITNAVRNVTLARLPNTEIHGLLLHEVRIGGGSTQIVASSSVEGVKRAADNLKTFSRAKVNVRAARAATRG